jgi:hypothetical protein
LRYEAVRAGVAQASQLVFDQVAPFKVGEDGPELTKPVAAA